MQRLFTLYFVFLYLCFVLTVFIMSLDDYIGKQLRRRRLYLSAYTYPDNFMMEIRASLIFAGESEIRKTRRGRMEDSVEEKWILVYTKTYWRRCAAD